MSPNNHLLFKIKCVSLCNHTFPLRAIPLVIGGQTDVLSFTELFFFLNCFDLW